MKKHYFFYLVLGFLFLTAQNGFSQDTTSNTYQQSIDGLSVFPNPVSNGKTAVFITTKQNALKQVTIYNVLGKQIASVVATRKELYISSLSSGVYILKITENSVTETRKLVIR